MSIPTTIEAREKLFDKEFRDIPGDCGNMVIRKNGEMAFTDDIKSFNHESYNELLRAMVEEIEGMKDRCPQGHLECIVHNPQCNQKLSTLQDKLKSYIK
jgi:hypothetical protein